MSDEYKTPYQKESSSQDEQVLRKAVFVSVDPDTMYLVLSNFSA
jgi:hypothetical protein